jgi:hypothetical protein
MTSWVTLMFSVTLAHWRKIVQIDIYYGFQSFFQ